MPLRHANRVAVISGAARGLGRAFAVRLAAEGATVAVADIQPADETVRLIAAQGGAAIGWECDVSAPDSVAALAAAVEARFGRCDILVNNAAVIPHQPFERLDFAEWRRVMSVNLDGAFLMSRAFVPGMIARGFGRIVNMASNTFGQMAPGVTHYVASKGGVIGFTRALATDLGKHGITVNALAPGFTETPGTIALGATSYRGLPWDELQRAIVAKQAIPRPERPEDLAGVVSFLASDDAAFITAQTLYVDGGLVRA